MKIEIDLALELNTEIRLLDTTNQRVYRIIYSDGDVIQKELCPNIDTFGIGDSDGRLDELIKSYNERNGI